MWFIGVDGGGSKSRALIMDSAGTVVGEGAGGPANPLHGYQQTIASITTALHQACEVSGLSQAQLNSSVACMGLAGVNLPSLRQQMNAWAHPFAHMILETDLHIACRAAHDGKDGAVVITGTGSCGLALVNGKETLYGAHGFPVGDKASGAWLGLEAIKTYLLASDGFVAPTLMQAALESHFNTRDPLQIVELMAGKGSAHFAQLAKLVFDCADQGDPEASRIIREGLQYLEQMIAFLQKAHPPRLAMLGGLAPLWLRLLPPEVASRVAPALISPQLAAAKLAQQIGCK